MKNIDCTLYCITNSDGMSEEAFLSKVKGACEGGVTLVQLREKIVLHFLIMNLHVK